MQKCFFLTQIKMLCCLFQCFKLGLKQRRLATLAFVIFAGLFLIIKTIPSNLPTKSPENEDKVKLLGAKKRGRHFSGDDKEDEDDIIRRNAKQETIRMLRHFAKG